ncbi:TIGR02221 family CRISPR-associated protein [Parabacteroides sp. ZJ-118]|uniref:TIGR02221 family CRISPR-associated protein n=1 Tax=Parabacteroides sp. ZJ-118 TaxID=2709398 RepID=UPI0013EDFA12|nr:TIGR02221 family CRISPR-associated protein [Parabacteroides sp. ZJ-118]
MTRKVFISVLGYSNYGKCFYTRLCDHFKSDEVRYVQEATLQYLTSVSEWTADDCAYVLLTKGAEQKNWNDNGHREYGTNVPIQQPGLASALEARHFPFSVIPVKDIPDGNDEKEIWQIFDRVFGLIQEGDELYFDLTHGFRYLPMLILVLGNYSKLLKNVVVRSITYGNYEARNKETNEAPLNDLLALSNLQDWTSASASFLKNGNLSMLKSLCQQNLAPVLREAKGSNQDALALKHYMAALENVVGDLNTCRGINILNGENFAELFKCSDQLKEVFIDPMKPVIERLKYSFQNFIPSQNIKNGYIASKWCFDNQLYQQSLTILHETIVSHVCEREGIGIAERGIVNMSFMIYNEKIAREDWQCNEEQVEAIEKLLNSELLKSLASTFVVTTTLRNDYNHAGMRKNPAKQNRFQVKLKERLDIILSMIENEEICS